MNRKRYLLLSLAFFALTCMQAQVILSPDKRSDLLEGMDRVINNVDRPVYSLSRDETPFYEVKREAPVQAVAKPQNQAAEPVAAVETSAPVALSDSAALGIISRQFKPIGSMILGTRGYLQLPGGGTIEKGQAFRAEIKGISYEVQISEVTEKGYTLQLGTASVKGSFNIQ